MANLYIYGYNEDAEINQVNKFRINNNYYDKNTVSFVYQPLLLQFLRNGSIFLQGYYTEIYLNEVLAKDLEEIQAFIDKYCFTSQSPGFTVQTTSTIELSLSQLNVLSANFVGNTDNVPEGTVNFYFTEQRVDNRIVALVQDSPNIQWVYNNNSFIANLSNTLVTPGTYGDATNIPQITIDQKGRITSAANVALTANFLTGDVVMGFGSTRSGFLIMQGGTIGNAASGATLLADASASSLFTYLWDNLANAEAPVSGGHGASAAADFAANKTITVPDMRQRFPIGKAAAGTGSTIGGIGGNIDHVHTVDPPSTNTSSDGTHNHGGVTGTPSTTSPTQLVLGAVASSTHTHNISSDGAHTHSVDIPQFNSGNNNPPFLAMNFFIKI